MIVELDENIFFNEDETILSDLSFIVREMLTEKHLWQVDNLYDCLERIEDTKWFANYLSAVEQEQFQELLAAILDKSAYITAVHKKYLRTLKIGLEHGQIPPNLAKVLLRERSKVIVENAIGDWKFIKGIAEKYRNQKKRKTLYKLLDKAIKNNWIEPENAGGKRSN